jgi:hypothetical protein
VRNSTQKKRPAQATNGPCDIEAEGMALGPILSGDTEAENFLDQLEDKHFSGDPHLTIFRAILAVQNDGAELNTWNVAERLKADGSAERIGGAHYLGELAANSHGAFFPSYLDTLKDFAARRDAIREAETTLRRAADLSTPFEVSSAKTFPSVEDAAAFVSADLPAPSELIWGVLHVGCKLAIGGGSKTFKSWALLDLALSVSHGEPWLSFKTTSARVCYVNLELPTWGIQRRLQAIARAKNMEIKPGQLQIWNLRGHAATYSELLPMLAGKLRKSGLGLLILDPVYKLYGDADENSARDISAMLNAFERLAQDTGAAVAFAAHFAKGNAASKEAIDRISGSGVFAREPDSIVTFTRHETENAFTVDATLRNHAILKPFVVSWDFPLMRRADGLDPAKIKQPQRGGGSVKSFTVEMLIDCLGKRKLNTAAFQKRCANESNITRATFYRLLGEAIKAGKITKDAKGKLEVSTGINKPLDTITTSQSHSPFRSETDWTGLDK